MAGYKADKSFLINPITALSKIRTIKVPKITYVGIELLVTALLTKPILMWINEFITGLIVCKLIKAVTAK